MRGGGKAGRRGPPFFVGKIGSTNFQKMLDNQVNLVYNVFSYEVNLAGDKMKIRKINNSQKFDKLTEAWRTLQVWQFGPLADLDDSDEDDNIQVLVAEVGGQAVAYLIAEDTDLWHIETREGHTGNGYAKRLVEVAEIDYAYEVCSDAGAEFCETLGIEFDDCR